MKKAFALSLVFLICLQALQPVLPFLQYQINYRFISGTLCENKNQPKKHCNGKCYLTKQLKKNAEQEQPNEEKAAKKAIKKVDYLAETKNKSALHTVDLNLSLFYSPVPALQAVYRTIPQPPPEKA